MNGLLFLNEKDFTIQQDGKQSKMMCCNIPGFSLILYYSTQCVYCQKLIPVYKKLPYLVNGCKFAMINISKNKRVIGMSKGTIAPVTYVPYIVLYINGQPFMRYDGPPKINDIRKFIVEVYNSVKHKQSFSKEATVKRTQESVPEKRRIPSYTIGLPKQGREDVCYLEFKEAYNKNKK